MHKVVKQLEFLIVIGLMKASYTGNGHPKKLKEKWTILATLTANFAGINTIGRMLSKGANAYINNKKQRL